MTEATGDQRLKKELGVARTNREEVDRPVTERRDISDEERLEMFRHQMFNDALPDLPPIPGYHVCWLTTTNPRDSIQKRMQLGYEPIRADEIPGMEMASVKTGEYAGMIGVNEMLAFKLKESLYQAFMREVHYDAPNREEERLSEVADRIRSDMEKAGSALIEDEGYQELRQSPAPLRQFT